MREVEDNLVRIECFVTWEQGIPVVSSEGEEMIVADFIQPTLDDYQSIERMAKKETETDSDIFRKWMIRRCLVDWNLDIKIERVNNWITNSSFRRVLGVYGQILDYLACGFEKVGFSLEAEEEARMMKQAAQLFATTGGSVTDACDGVSLYCNLGNMWDKFGFTNDSIGKMRFIDYMRLKFMLTKESDFSKSSSGSFRPPSSPTMITGPGGRTSPSRARVVPDGTVSNC